MLPFRGFRAMKAFENTTAFQLMKAYENSPSFQLMKAFENSSSFQLMKALENSTSSRLMRALDNSSSFRLIKALENSTSFQLMKSFENSASYNLLKSLSNPVSIGLIKSLGNSSILWRFSGVSSVLENVDRLRLGVAYQEVVRRHEEVVASGIPDAFDIVTDDVEARIRKTPHGPLGADFFINLIITILLFYLSQASSKQSEERIIAKLEKIQAIVIQQLSESQKKEEFYTFYVVERPAKLLANPNTKSTVITPLYPNATLQLIERQSEWVKVLYFDHLVGEYRDGWVLKKTLKILNRKQSIRR